MLVTSQSFERSDSVRKRDWFNSLYTVSPKVEIAYYKIPQVQSNDFDFSFNFQSRSKPRKDDEVKNNTLLRPYSYFKVW